MYEIHEHYTDVIIQNSHEHYTNAIMRIKSIDLVLQTGLTSDAAARVPLDHEINPS